MRGRARKLYCCGEGEITNIATRQGYAESLPFDDSTFDVVISRYSAHHWHDVGQALREVKRVLKPGGIAIFMDVTSPGHPVKDIWLQTVEALRDTSHVRNYSSGEWLSLFNDAGLDDAEPAMRQAESGVLQLDCQDENPSGTGRSHSHLPAKRIR
jgi:ubiquinone/menaquinone biosynthesis C-methylase UbiE